MISLQGRTDKTIFWTKDFEQKKAYRNNWKTFLHGWSKYPLFSQNKSIILRKHVKQFSAENKSLFPKIFQVWKFLSGIHGSCVHNKLAIRIYQKYIWKRTIFQKATIFNAVECPIGRNKFRLISSCQMDK